MIAVIAGATGLVGSALLKKLVADPHYSEIISVTRRSMDVQSTKLKEVIVTDFSQLNSVREKLKGDIYFCCLGTTIKSAGSKENFIKVDHDAVLDFAKIAKSHHASSFILVSAQGANPKSKVFYNRVKGQLEEDLKSLSLARLVFMHPSLLIGDRKEFRLGEKIAMGIVTKLAPVLPKKVKKLAMTEVEVLAQRMIEESKLRKSGLSIISAQHI